jgi:manganese efflux pump family protein
MLKLIAIVLPLALDSLGAAVAVGLAGGAGRRQALFLFPVMETAAAALGLLLGLPLASAIGDSASYVGAAAVIVVGVVMLFGVGLAIGVDELVLGFSLGLLGLPPGPALALIAVQAIVVSQVGIRLGGRIGARLGERAERLGGAALVLVGLFLLVEAAL